MRLRHPKPVLNHSTAADTVKAPFASHITRWLYFGALLALLLYILWYSSYRFFYIHNRGLVNVDRIRISSSRGGRIIELAVKNGDHVQKGDLLVRLKAMRECFDANGNPIESEELRGLKLRLAANQAKLKGLYSQRSLLKKQIDEMKYRRAMELSLGSGAAASGLESSRVKLNTDIQYLLSMIDLQKQEIEQLQSASTAANRPECADEVIRAPSDATVVSKDHHLFEVVQRSEPIFDLVADDAKVQVESYFRTDAFTTVHYGMELTVYFPDGSTSQGRVVDLKSTAMPFPNRGYHEDYLPYRTRILALLAPVHDEDRELWKQFNQSEVEVQGWR